MYKYSECNPGWLHIWPELALFCKIFVQFCIIWLFGFELFVLLLRTLFIWTEAAAPEAVLTGFNKLVCNGGRVDGDIIWADVRLLNGFGKTALPSLPSFIK